MPVGAAIGIAGVAGAGATIYGSSKAAGASRDATQANNALQQQMYNQQRADQEPWRQVGAQALNPLAARVMGGGAGSPTGAPAAQMEPDWEAFVTTDEGMRQNYEKYGKPNGMSVAAFGQWFNEQYGSQDGRDVPMRAMQAQAAPAPQPQPQAAPGANQPTPVASSASYGPQVPQREVEQRGPDPVYQAPAAYNAPTYTPPNALDVSLSAYTPSPDYQWQIAEGNRNILATSSATGAMQSGAALKALQDRAQNIAMGDYAQWREYTTGQYNTDRNFGRNVFESDRGFGRGVYESDRGFGRNVFESDRSRGDRQFEVDRAFNADIYNTDRGYLTDRIDRQTNDLFQLSGLGANANAANAQAGQSYAGNVGNALFSNAANQGNAWLSGANAFNNTLNSAATLYGYQQGYGGYGSPYQPRNFTAGPTAMDPWQYPALRTPGGY